MPSLYDTIGFASNFFAMLNGIKAAHYLKHISKITNNFDWFLNGFSKYNKISNYLGYMNAVVDGVNVWYLTGDFFKGAITGIYDWGALIMSSELGILLGGLIGGPVGAIIGTLTGIGIEFVIQIFKEEFVDWLDKKIDNLYNWISDKWGELING